MSEELLQRGLIERPEKIGKWDFYNIGATNLKSLKNHKILKDISYPKYDLRKPDGLIVYKGDVIALVSNKVPRKLNKNKEVSDWVEVTRALKSKLLIITDANTKTFWINALTGKPIKDEKGNELNTFFAPSKDETPKLIEQIIDSISNKSNQLKKPELKDPTPLAQSVWQDIWSASGDDPENCLYTFVELFVFKYLSDLNVLSGFYSFDELLKKYETNTSIEVLQFYADVIRIEIKKKFKENPTDKTTIINGSTFVNKQGNAVSGYSTVFKKVLFKFHEYENKYGKFDHIHYEFKSKIFETFLKENISKKNWGQYFTPLKVVRAIVKMAKSDVRDNVTICDPACGVGKFLLEVIAENPYKFYDFEGNKLSKKITLIGYDKGFEEKEQKTIILAKANMLIYLSDLIKEHSGNCNDFSNLFNDTFKLQTQTTLGTLFNVEKEKYDLILTNPPYVTDGSSNLKEEITVNKLQYNYSISSMGIEGLFLQWIVNALKPNGKAFIVVPEGVLIRTADKELRKFISETCFIDGIISLPSKTFFNTIQKTYILAITKKTKKKEIQESPIFSYLVSEIGETLDINRFDTDINHLDISASLFNQFKNDRINFKANDSRCKIIDAKQFIANADKSWEVDSLWTKEEKIALKIIESDKRVTVKGFSGILGETSSIILSYQKQIEALLKKKEAKTAITRFKEVKITDLFEFITGKSKYTQIYINRHVGEYPVYSSNTKQNGLLGHINTYDHNMECLQLTTNGVYAGTFFYRNKHKFSINGDAKLLVRKDTNLDYQYFLFELQDVFGQHGFNWQKKPSKSRMQDITIKVPVKKNGEYDYEVQQEISKEFKTIETIKQEFSRLLEDIAATKVSLA